MTSYEFIVILSKSTIIDEADSLAVDPVVEETIIEEDDEDEVAADLEVTEEVFESNLDLILGGQDLTEVSIIDLPNLVTDYVSSKVEGIAKAQEDETLLAIEIADVLGIENVEAALANSQKVMKIEDDTDFDEVAKFDFLTYLTSKGIEPSWQEETMPSLVV